MNPVIYIDLEYSPPKLKIPGRRPQPWRLVARSAGNHEVIAVSSEKYTNKADAVAAAELLFNDTTTVFLRQAEHGNRLLRQGKPF